MSPFELGAWGPTNKLRLMTIGGEPERGPVCILTKIPYGRPTGCSYHFFSQAVSAPVHRHPSLAGGACGLKGRVKNRRILTIFFPTLLPQAGLSRVAGDLGGI